MKLIAIVLQLVLLATACSAYRMSYNSREDCRNRLEKVTHNYLEDVKRIHGNADGESEYVNYHVGFQKNCEYLLDTFVTRYVVLLMEDGMVDEARTEITKNALLTLIGDKIIISIMSKLYGSSNFRRCLEFFSGLGCSVYGDGLDTFFSIMKNDNENLRDPEKVLILSRYVSRYGCETNKHVKETQDNLQPYVNAILNKWGHSILSGNSQEIYNFANRGNVESDSVEVQVPSLVKNIFGSYPENFNKTVNFVRGFSHLQSHAPGYQSIVVELKNQGKTYSEEMLYIAFRVYQLMITHKDVILDNQRLTKVFSDLKNSIPPPLQNLIWKWTCSLKNAHWSEYLYATKDSSEGGNGDVYTWLTGSKVSAAEWVIIPLYYHGHFVYFIKNKNLSDESRYMCESKASGKIMTCDPNSSAGYRLWYIKPVVRNGNMQFVLKNSPYGNDINDYLQAGSYHDIGLKRRNVKDASMQETSYWIINCY